MNIYSLNMKSVWSYFWKLEYKLDVRHWMAEKNNSTSFVFYL